MVRGQAPAQHLLGMQGGRLGAAGEGGSATLAGERAAIDEEEVFAAALDLVSDGARSFKRAARRVSLCAEDAEDAYQRGLEILLTKAPTADPAELRPWLHTVIKHEALALRRQRERLLGAPAAEASSATTPGPEEGSPERERGRRTAEALGQLKPSEIQCLLLKALGYSYDEIAARTGYSWTKVNRSLTEGRRRFFKSFDQIESGRRCRSLEPLLSSLCDGEAPAKREREMRAHLRGCSACRATLRAYRTAPSRLAELVPPALVLPAVTRSSWWSRLYDMISVGAGERVGAAGYKLQQAVELAGAQKTAAVVASTAALAGGAVAGEHVVHRHHAPRTGAGARAEHSHQSPKRLQSRSTGVVASPLVQTRSNVPRKPRAAREGTRKREDRGQEFSLEGAPAAGEAAASSARAAEVSRSTPAEAPGSFESGGRSGRTAGARSGGEFGP
jgi:RNA polymerase sigma factor (sigma-70 family)